MHAASGPIPRLRNALDPERGATLVELLISVAISASLIVLLGTAIYQFFLVTRLGNDRMLALSDVQSASLWLTRDVAEAASFAPGSGAEYGTFYWPGGDPAFRYRYDAAGQALVRDHLVSGSVQSSLTVARGIRSQGDVVFTPGGNLLNITLNSTIGDETASLSLDMAMRVR